ncbi:MAG: LysR family transcriptional regulator [Ruminococcaceae bacterium]|nr:LysR family transcriptional regulator [Oscillospiraceae bacterium]
MELSPLYYFKITAETGNVTRAAEILNVSQPALSRAMTRLESSLGVALFIRQKGRISLSETGKNFYTFIAKAFEQIEAAENYIAQEREGSDSVVRIATTASELLSTMTVDFYSRGPQSDVKIQQLTLAQNEIIHRLKENKLDFAITTEAVDDRELTMSLLLTEEVFLVISRDHPLAGYDGAEVSLGELRNERFLINESVLSSDAVTEFCRSEGFEPDIFISCNENEVLKDALHMNTGVSMAPASKLALQFGEPEEKLAVVRFRGHPLQRKVYFITRKDKVFLSNSRRFASHTKGYFRKLGDMINNYPIGYFEKGMH